MASTQSAAAAASAYQPPQYRRLTTYEQHAAEGATTDATAPFNNGNSPSFSDLVDILNPLQHIPVINTIYRAVTGDHESAMADIIGGTLYGGPIGTAAAIADLGLRDATGKTSGEHVMAWMGFDAGAKTDGATAVAAAQTATPAQPAAAGATAAAAPAPKHLTVAMADSPRQATPTQSQATTQPQTNFQAGPQLGAPTALQAGPMPEVTQSTLAANAAGGPVTMGDYLVFGSAPTGAAAVTPASLKQNPASPAPTVQGQAGTGPSFATIGANAQPAPVLPTISAPPASAQAGAPVMAATKTAAAMPLHQHMFPAPPRTGPATPAQNLPPPTTGPGALPGGKSQALSPQDQAMLNQNQAFLSAYTKALEKYQSAQRLGTGGAGAPIAGVSVSGPMGGAPAAPAPTNLIQPANDIAEDKADENNTAVTVH